MGVRCGSRHEAPGLEGMAHLVEHMLFKGTKSIPSPSKISELIEISGGSLNAATDYETTVYWCRVLSEKAEESLQLLFQLITEPLLRPVDLELERKVIIEEIKTGMSESILNFVLTSLPERYDKYIIIAI